MLAPPLKLLGGPAPPPPPPGPPSSYAYAFGTPKFYIAPYDKIKHELVKLSSNCDVKSGRSLSFTTRALCACSRCGGQLVYIFSLAYLFQGWSGGAMVLRKLPVPRRLTYSERVRKGPAVLTVGAGGGCLDIFSRLSFLSSLSFSLGDGPI